MRVLVMRSGPSKVLVDNKTVGSISKGLVLLVGFTAGDGIDEIIKMAHKVVNLRIFNDENGVMNCSLLDQVEKEILSISQFTLYADTKKGMRPSYIKALSGDKAKPLYEMFNEELKKYAHVETGVFGADMTCQITNDGPTTILLEKENECEK